MQIDRDRDYVTPSFDQSSTGMVLALTSLRSMQDIHDTYLESFTPYTETSPWIGCIFPSLLRRGPGIRLVGLLICQRPAILGFHPQVCYDASQRVRRPEDALRLG